MRYKAILFDMDGTVLDTLRDLNAAANTALAEFGFPAMSLDETRRRVGNGSRRLLELSLPEGTPDDILDRILAWYLPYYNAHANDTTAPYPGIAELLAALKAAGTPLAVVSNKHASDGGGSPGRRAGRLSLRGRFGGRRADGRARGDGLRFGALGLSQPGRAGTGGREALFQHAGGVGRIRPEKKRLKPEKDKKREDEGSRVLSLFTAAVF